MTDNPAPLESFAELARAWDGEAGELRDWVAAVRRRDNPPRYQIHGSDTRADQLARCAREVNALIMALTGELGPLAEYGPERAAQLAANRALGRGHYPVWVDSDDFQPAAAGCRCGWANTGADPLGAMRDHMDAFNRPARDQLG